MKIPIDSFEAYNLDDGSIMIEMYGRDFRIGITIDKDTNESGMWLVCNQKLDKILEPHHHRIFDLFPPEMVEMIAKINTIEKPYEIECWEDDGGQ